MSRRRIAIGRYRYACLRDRIKVVHLNADPLDEAVNPLRGACYGGSITCQPGHFDGTEPADANQ